MPLGVSMELKKFIKSIEEHGYIPKYYLVGPSRNQIHS